MPKALKYDKLNSIDAFDPVQYTRAHKLFHMGAIMFARFVIILLTLFSAATFGDGCPSAFDVSLRKLNSTISHNLCDLMANRPALIVNTASYCGFTPQFSALETIYRQYRKRGLVVLGFASNDFDQEAKSEKEAAHMCFSNYGVSFTMFAPIRVKGENAHPVFQFLSAKTKAPAWNFSKYLVSADGNKVAYFPSEVPPTDSRIHLAIEEFLSTTKSVGDVAKVLLVTGP